MVIIFQQGDKFWIETIISTPAFDPPDAAGVSTAAVMNLERPGRFVGGMLTIVNAVGAVTNSQAIAYIQILDQGSGGLDYGERITGIVPRIVKGAGTGASQLIFVATLFMRKNT